MDIDAPRELRKFPKGERCQTCGSKRWYWESGHAFCRQGHQVEGLIQYDFGEDEFGITGRVSRKEKEIQKREKQKLSGRAARDLYLECLQLILRKQLEWLVDGKGFKTELETVVRDLWDLRLRGSPAAPVGDGADTDPNSDGELSVFSSQTEMSKDEQSRSGRSRSRSRSSAQHRKQRARSWSSDAGDRWPTPKVVDLLALCYLGCLLLRIPVRVGDFVRWAKGGNITYKQANHHLPEDMWARLPATYQRLFQSADLAHFDKGELHSAVTNLALSYHVNYGMEFPPLNDVPVMLQFARELGLPVETVSVARRIPPITSLSFSFPLDVKRMRAIHHPEIALVSVLVLATQYCFPFEDVTVPPLVGERVFIPKMDWDRWRQIMAGSTSGQARGDPRDVDFRTATTEDITSMSPAELDKYFAYMSMQIDTNENQEDENFLLKYFPVEGSCLRPADPEEGEEELDKRLRQIQLEATRFETGDESVDATESGMRYFSYRSLDDLPPTGREFYDLAAKVAGLSAESLLKSVVMLELHVRYWAREQRKRTRRVAERMTVDGTAMSEAEGTAPLGGGT